MSFIDDVLVIIKNSPGAIDAALAFFEQFLDRVEKAHDSGNQPELEQTLDEARRELPRIKQELHAKQRQSSRAGADPGDEDDDGEKVDC